MAGLSANICPSPYRCLWTGSVLARVISTRWRLTVIARAVVVRAFRGRVVAGIATIAGTSTATSTAAARVAAPVIPATGVVRVRRVSRSRICRRAITAAAGGSSEIAHADNIGNFSVFGRCNKTSNGNLAPALAKPRRTRARELVLTRELARLTLLGLAFSVDPRLSLRAFRVFDTKAIHAGLVRIARDEHARTSNVDIAGFTDFRLRNTGSRIAVLHEGCRALAGSTTRREISIFWTASRPSRQAVIVGADVLPVILERHDHLDTVIDRTHDGRIGTIRSASSQRSRKRSANSTRRAKHMIRYGVPVGARVLRHRRHVCICKPTHQRQQASNNQAEKMSHAAPKIAMMTNKPMIHP